MKPKVLFIMHMPPPVHGAAVMGQYIHDSRLINEAFDCYYINPSISKTVGSVGKFDFSKVWMSFLVCFKILHIMLTKKINLCYFTATLGEGPGVVQNVLIIFLLKIFNKKIILHFHNKGCKRAVQKSKIYHYAYKYMFHQVKVILLSDLLYSDVEDYVKWEDVYICPNGIPVEGGWKKDDARCLKDDEKRRTRLLFLSNLIVSKGVLVLLDALKMLKEKGYDFVCDFVGGETKEIDAKRFDNEVAARGLQGIAQYLGKKYGEEKDEVYRKADIFVFPTHNETFGLVLLEAMQYGVPVISTNEGGVPDIVKHGENGFLCPKKDASSLAIHIEKLLVDKGLRERMGKRGMQMFNEQFTLEVFEKNMCKILHKMIY